MMTTTIQTIQSDIARVIQRETGAAVEVTVIATDQFSVFALGETAITAARGILTGVPGVRLDDSATYSHDGETEYYDYYAVEAI